MPEILGIRRESCRNRVLSFLSIELERARTSQIPVFGATARSTK